MSNLSHQTAQIVTIDVNRVDQRIDNFLLSYLKSVPRSHIYKILRKGEVRVNKGRIKAHYKLQLNDQVRVPPIKLLKTDNETTVPKEIINAVMSSILYEDQDMIIINKPAGLAVHGGSNISYSLIQALRQARIHDDYLELIHRLDRDTSGCIMIAKNIISLRNFHHLLKNGKITKRYHALLMNTEETVLQEKQFTVNEPLLRSQLSSDERMVMVDSKGQEAITKFKIISRFGDYNLVEVIPVTGRTHQIRVHAAYINAPVAGDTKYGNKDFNKKMKQLGLSRLFLHSKQLEFKSPTTGEFISVEAPYDNKLQSILTSLSK